MSVSILVGDCRDRLRELAPGSVQSCVTSPPYFGLRDYGVDGQIGLELTPDAYVQQVVEVFREVRRVLRDDGTLWLNLGDSYAGSWGAQGRRESDSDEASWHGSQIKNHPKRARQTGLIRQAGLKPKDLIGIPWMVAFALRADGWYLRQDIIWSKPNPMPESVQDRCTKAHEYLFMLSKSPSYYYDIDAILQPIAAASVARLSQNLDGQSGSERIPGKTNGAMKAVSRSSGNLTRKLGSERGCPANTGSNVCGNVPWEGSSRNRRSVWTVATQPFKEAHFATYPPELIEPCILAGCPKGGVVLDPFFGAGTTGLVADRLGRDCIGIELNPAYADIAKHRLNSDAGMFSRVEVAA